ERTIYAFEPGAVHLDPMSATQALARIVQRLGVEIVEGCEVTKLDVVGPMVHVTTEAETIESPVVLLGTSCWLPLQLERFGRPLPIRPHRAEMCFFQAPARSDRRLVRILSDAASGIYLRPEGAEQMFVGWREGDWIKSLDDCVVQDPDHCRQTADFTTVRKMHHALSTTLPWMHEGFVHRTFACTYDYSPDGMPILDRLEGTAGIYLAAGFSGGGFSLSPFVGRTMAEYIHTGRRPNDVAELSWQRFREGKSIEWSNH
ncbi:MAG: FAD-binding oxidoreductase, partial [Planctomycetaceae bacterium]